MREAQHIIDEEFAAAGVATSSTPVVISLMNGDLEMSDGNVWETLASDEAGIRSQCRAWIGVAK